MDHSELTSIIRQMAFLAGQGHSEEWVRNLVLAVASDNNLELSSTEQQEVMKGWQEDLAMYLGLEDDTDNGEGAEGFEVTRFGEEED